MNTGSFLMMLGMVLLGVVGRIMTSQALDGAVYWSGLTIFVFSVSHRLVWRSRCAKPVVLRLQRRRMFSDVRLLGHDVLLCSETGGSADLSLSTAHGEPRLGSRRWCGDTSMAPASGPKF